MRVLHLLTSGHAGGIECLCRDIGACSDFDNGFCFFTDAGIICRQMQEQGLTVYDLSKQGRKFSLHKLWQAAKIAQEYSVIVVHHNDPFLWFYYVLLKLLTGKPGAMYMHHIGYDPPKGSAVKRILGEWILRLSLLCSNCVISVSRAVEESFESYMGSRKPHYVVYNGVSQTLLEQGRGNLPRTTQPFQLTYVGRLSKGKSVDVLIRAGKILRRRFDIRLCIVGDGACREELECLCREEGMEDITVFYGQQPSPAPYLKGSTVFVSPSKREAFSVSLLEAMAFGIPCVCNRVGGNPEAVSHGESGLLCDGFTPEELAEKIQTLLESDMAATSRCARETAERFTIQNTVQNLKAVLQRIGEKE